MSRKFISILMSLLLASFMFIVACGDDDPKDDGPGDGNANGGFSMESGSVLTETELDATLDGAFTNAGAGLGGLGNDAEAQNALVGLAFGEAAISEVNGILGDADIFGSLSKLALAKTVVDTSFELDLLNGVIMTISVMDVTDGRSFTITADGACTADPSITFTNTTLASGFLSTNFRNGEFSYNVGNLFDATLCGDFGQGEFSGTWAAEWAIAADGTVSIFVDLDFQIAVDNGGVTQTIDYDYVSEITINPDGSGNAVGSVSYSIDGTVLANDTFNVTWS